jgi:dienelactone hydrolase
VGQDIKLTASDNFQLGGYRADPRGAPKGAIVVIQEIFGVNHHIRNVCDRLAGEGYVAIAPSIFDRIEPNFTSGYSPDEIANARKFVANPDWAAMLRDTQAAIDAVKTVGPVGIIGFCLGGSVAYAAATKLSGLKAAVGYYGGAIVRFADGADATAFRRKGHRHPSDRCRDHQGQAAGGRDLHLSRRTARLSLRRARKLRQGQRRHRLAAQHGVFRQASEKMTRSVPSAPSFRDGPKGQTRNLGVPGSMLAHRPGMTE